MRNKIFSLFILLLSSSLCHGEIMDQLNNSKDETPLIIEAEEQVVCDETARKCVAKGKAMAQKGTNKVFGDILTAYLTDERKITAVTADGNVRMETPTDRAYGEHAHYDMALDRIIMTGGNLKITTPKETLTARDSLEFWHKENKGIAKGNAIAIFPAKGELVQADTLVAYFKKSSEKKKDGEEKQSLDRIEAEGNVLASNPKGVVTGDRGIYLSNANRVEIFDNVKIMQEDNIIEGGYARYNLKTSIAEMFTAPPHVVSEKPSKRISGIIIPEHAKKLKDDKDKLSGKKKKKDKDRQIFPTSAKTEKHNPLK